MRKFKLFSLCMFALSLIFVGCNPGEDPTNVDNIVEDGFYVVGEAAAIVDLKAEGANKSIMAVGINENDGQKVREGMYEKYIALKGGKPFSLVLKEGKVETKYGATLEKVNLANEEGGQVNEQPTIEIYQGSMTENSTMQVAEDGLYHIVLDLNKDNKLSGKLIIIAPVEWGVAGAMNGWGFTTFTKPTFNQESMTYTMENVKVESDGGFKFKYGNGWKIQLNTLAEGADVNDPGYVKANTNLGNNATEDDEDIKGNDLKPGGKNIKIARGIYTITLKWNLAQGDVKNSYSATLTKTGEVAVTYPEKLYMVGASIGGWDWNGSYIIELNPVHSHPHAFWTIAYIDAPATDPGFKFSPVKDWAGDFGVTGEAVDGVYAKGGNNATVAEAGYYMVYVDLKAEKISVTPPTVYGMGNAFGGWDAGVAANLFTIDNTAKTVTSPAFSGSDELRMYATCALAAADETSVDWWQTEFIVLDGKIEYRGKGNDQTRVSVTAGQKVVLNFQAGTGTIQ